MEEIKKRRGRPKGSTNKASRTSGSLRIMNFEKQIDGSAITRPNALGWVNWGQKNDYPNLLLDLYNMSPTHRAAVNFAVMSIVGNGVDYKAMGLDGSQLYPNEQYSWDDLIRNISLDYVLYGSYAVQVIKNKDGNTYSYWHMPLDKVRWSEYDEDGNIPYYWICSDWTATGKYVPYQIPALDQEHVETGQPYLYVYRQYSPAMTYYTQPSYQAAIKSIQSEVEYVNFDLKSTVNGFVPSGMLVLNDVETDEERGRIIDNVTRMFQGTDNANSVMISFRDNVEQTSPEFIPFSTGGDTDLYASANERTVNRILAGHQIPNASLVGMPDVNGSGFASEADKLEVAYQLYNKLTGNNNRMAVIKTLNMMFGMNGIDVEVVMKPLSFNDFGNDADVAERTSNTTNEVIEEDVNYDNQ